MVQRVFMSKRGRSYIFWSEVRIAFQRCPGLMRHELGYLLNAVASFKQSGCRLVSEVVEVEVFDP